MMPPDAKQPTGPDHARAPAQGRAEDSAQHAAQDRTELKKICIAKFGAAHGVRGEVRLWPFTEDPLAVLDYGETETLDGTQRFTITQARVAKDHLVARVKGCASRDDAERLNGIELYVPRERLPAADADEYYHADLIGLAAQTADGTALGRVVAVQNFGAGDLLEIRPPGGRDTVLYPFTNAVVPQVDLAAGRIVIAPPNEIEGEKPPRG